MPTPFLAPGQPELNLVPHNSCFLISDDSVCVKCHLPLMTSTKIQRFKNSGVSPSSLTGRPRSPPPQTAVLTSCWSMVNGRISVQGDVTAEDTPQIFRLKLRRPTEDEEAEEEVEDVDDYEDSLDEEEEEEDTPSSSKPKADVSAFEKVCTIGTGTFGRVFLVREKSSGEHFALKVMAIHDVVHMKQVEHVHSEKSILLKVDHPFIIKTHWTYHDSKALYILFDYVHGGEMFSYLRGAGNFSNRVCQFYAAEIVSALEYLHKQNIVYRDLKPENLLLDREGHLRITDFGFAKELYDRSSPQLQLSVPTDSPTQGTWTLCGTPEYLAPEVIESRGHNRAVDWWALGVLIYEMQAGYPPFRGDNALRIYEQILEGRVKFPKEFDLVAKDLVKKLLSSDRTQRLGNMKGGAEDVKRHKWFREVIWEDVAAKKLKPPIVPKIYSDGDSGNFDEYEEEDLNGFSEAVKEELSFFKNW